MSADTFDDPDRLDVAALAFVTEAASLLRAEARPRAQAVDRTVARVRMEAFIGSVAGNVGGALGRLAAAAPDLLGFYDEDEDLTS